MSGKKLLYFFGILIVIILLVFSFYLANKQAAPNSTATSAATSTSLTIPVPGGSMPVNNITQNPVQTETDTVLFAQTNQYSIIYYPTEQTFSITINAQPVQAAREAAEAALLQKLGITQTQACSLTVSTYVPYGVDQNLAGQDYGLSFCPGGKQFDQ